MESRLKALEEKVTRLADRLDQLEQRLSGGPLPSLPQSWPLGEPELRAPVARVEMSRWVTFLGRSCLVLGGAFLIRALTDGGVLPAGPGVAMGIVFAAIWLVLAHRAALAGAKVIACPTVEQSQHLSRQRGVSRRGVMSASAAALAGGLHRLLLVVAWRDRHYGWSG
jgi:hypothetical protein